MDIFLNIVGSFVLTLSFAWALLPGGFGKCNYQRNHGRLPGLAAGLCWWLLLLVHPLALGLLWLGHGDITDWLPPLALQLLFFGVFGRDVSTG